MTMRVIRGISRGNRRLDSWKEIAAFLGRDERTVKRWEKGKGLPVHRMPEMTGARVFAFTEELERWIKGPDSSGAKQEDEQQLAPERPVVTTCPETLPKASWRKALIGIGAVLFAVSISAMVAYLRPSHSPNHSEAARASASSVKDVPASNKSASEEVDPQAQELYFAGRYYWDKRTPDDLEKAVSYFNRAIKRDPNYAAAYVGLANCYSLLREFAAMPSEEAFPRALAAARKAVELDDSSAEAHNALALVTFYWNWDSSGAEREFRRAIELNPNYVTAHHWYATFLLVLGRFPEALQQIEIAQQLDPGSTPILADKALIFFVQGDLGQAMSLLKQLSASQPDLFSTHQYLSYIYLYQRDCPNYLKEAAQAAVLSHDAVQADIVRAAKKGFHSGGRSGMLQNILRVQKEAFDAGSESAFFIAETYARLGDKKEALSYLKTSFERHEVAFLAIRVARALEPLHEDLAFRQLVEEAGIPPLP